MNPALLLMCFATAFGTLLGAQWFVHQSFTRAMEDDVRAFEKKWLELEERYAKN